MQLTEYTGVRINIKVKKLLKKQANKEGRTLSGLINKALEFYLNNAK